eukprot:s2419_g2.t1
MEYFRKEKGPMHQAKSPRALDDGNLIFKTQLPGAWQQHSTPRTPSGAGPAALLPAAPPLPGAGSAWPKQNGFTLPNYQRVR